MFVECNIFVCQSLLFSIKESRPQIREQNFLSACARTLMYLLSKGRYFIIFKKLSLGKKKSQSYALEEKLSMRKPLAPNASLIYNKDMNAWTSSNKKFHDSFWSLHFPSMSVHSVKMLNVFFHLLLVCMSYVVY